MTPTQSPLDLEAIEARAAAATPGPWRNDHPSWMEVNDITVWCGPEGDDAMCVCNMGAPIAAVSDIEEAKVSYANGEFVAHSRTDIPLLIAEVRRLREVVERLPKTADGVVVVSGDTVYHPKILGVFRDENDFGIPRAMEVEGWGASWLGDYAIPVSECYSTRAAALAASQATEPTREEKP